MFEKVLVLVALGLVLLSTIEAKHTPRRHVEEESQENLEDKVKKGGSIWRRKRAAESTSTNDDSTSESVHFNSAEAVELVKYFVKASWKENKGEMLSELITEVADSDTNITVIGWQQILAPDGTVEQINVVEFVVPPKPETDEVGNFEVDDEEDEDEDEDELGMPHKKIKQLREVFKPFSLIGIPTFITYESFDKTGKETGRMFIDKDELYVNTEGFALYNRTVITASPEDVKESLAIAKKYRGYSVINKKQNQNETFTTYVDGETHPLFVGNVLSYEQPVDEIFLAAPGIIADIGVRGKIEEFPKELVKRFNHDFPAYKWRVLVDPGDYSVTFDTAYTVSADNFDFYENSGNSYFVYGKKK